MNKYIDVREQAKRKIRRMSSKRLNVERKTYNADFKRIALKELQSRGVIKKKKRPTQNRYPLTFASLYRR